jgi:hypothetical protein
MLYKRGKGTQAEPYSVCYRWNVVPAISARAGDNIVTLSFPGEITNNGSWPEAKAWRLTDSRGTNYSVTGLSAVGNRVTLTVFPVLAENVELTVEYTQGFDDVSQGLNNTKGAILWATAPPNSFLRFGLPGMTLKTVIDKNDDGGEEEDNNNDSNECGCEKNAGTCLCGMMNSRCGCTQEKNNALRILSDTVHYLVLNQPFVLDLEAEGGTAPYSWEIDDALPEGLSFSDDGTVEGSPTASGSFRATIRVSDSAEAKVSKKFSFLVVEDEKLAIVTDTLPDAQVGVFYTARVRGSGGTKPYAWEIESLPGWLQFDSPSGILSGVPTETAIHDLMVRVGDGEGTSESKLLRFSVYPHDGLTVTTRVLPAAVYSQEYSTHLESIGGIPPYFFTLRRETSLPPGLVLDSAGKISGTSTQKGVYVFTVDVIDGNGLQGGAVYTMAILDAEALAPSPDDFTTKGYESEKRILLKFSLPKDFDDATILDAEALTSPDSYIAGSRSAITKEQSGYKVELTLQVAEHALNNGGNWSALLEKLTIDGITVKFQDASGEEVRFETALSVKDMQKEKEPEGSNTSGSDSGGCNADWGMSLISLALVAVLKAIKRTR